MIIIGQFGPKSGQNLSKMVQKLSKLLKMINFVPLFRPFLPHHIPIPHSPPQPNIQQPNHPTTLPKPPHQPQSNNSTPIQQLNPDQTHQPHPTPQPNPHLHPIPPFPHYGLIVNHQTKPELMYYQVKIWVQKRRSKLIFPPHIYPFSL